MPRTGQPSTRDVEATVRAVAILDALADGGELGTTDLARRTGISPSTVSRQLGTLTRVGLVEHVAGDGPLPARRAGAAARERRARPAQPARRRPPPPRGARARGRRDRRRSRSRATADAITVDFVPTDRYLQGVTRLGRPSVGHASSAGQGDARVRRRAAPARAARGVHAAHDHRPGRARRRRSSACGRRATPRRSRSARPGLSAIAAPVWGAGGALAAIVALQGPTSRFDADAMQAALPLLLQCAERISGALGWDGVLRAQRDRRRSATSGQRR